MRLVISVVLIFLISACDKPKTELEKKKELVQALEIKPLGLISKKRITDNIEETATVWEEVHRVKGGVVTMRTSVNEYTPKKFITNIAVYHHDVDGNKMYSRIADSNSKSLTIYRNGIKGWFGKRNGEIVGATEVVDFKEDPSDQCFRNRIALLDMPKVCSATIKISSATRVLRLKLNSDATLLYDSKGKLVKNIKSTETDYESIVKRYLESFYREANVAGELDEFRI